MINKKDSSDPIDNLEYEKVLEDEIINSYESKFQKDTKEDIKKIKFYRLKRTPLEILNRSFFFLVPSMYGTRIFNNHFLIELNGFIIYLLAFSPQTPPFNEILYIWPSCY